MVLGIVVGRSRDYGQSSAEESLGSNTWYGLPLSFSVDAYYSPLHNFVKIEKFSKTVT